jgi:histone deacetylase HOS3
MTHPASAAAPRLCPSLHLCLVGKPFGFVLLSLSMATAPSNAIYLQDACLAHQYIRNSDTGNVAERPERIHAVKVGLAAAVARLEHIHSSKTSSPEVKLEHSTKLKSGADAVGLLKPDDSAGDLVAVLSQMKIEANSPGPSSPLVASTSTLPLIGIVYSTASVNLLNNPAVKFIHGDIDGDVYLEKLISWAKTSEEKIAEGGSEIPNKMPQGDLYCV